ncbi:MAG: hypothetical protein VXY06_02270 [Bacteroidota bacterium]|nr:hypothetical protein [Bacteroidota bacterium]
MKMLITRPFFIILCILSSCKNEKPTFDKLEIHRLDSLYVQDVSLVSYSDLQSKYGYFWQVYTQNVINLPQESFKDSLLSFQNLIDFQQPYQDLSALYADFSLYEDVFSEAFFNYNQLFPNRLIPSIVLFFGGFNYIAIATDSTLAIGLEMFLGKDAPYYQRITHKFPQYMHQRFQPDNMVPVAIEGWLESEFYSKNTDFLSQMIHYGKIKYVLSQLIKKQPSHIYMGYSKEQLIWCEENEFSIWKFLIEEGLLYSTDQFLINKYMNPSPYTRGMPAESPGQVPIWIGWNIVSQFMDKRSDVTISELMEIYDAQYILSQSKYRPK